MKREEITTIKLNQETKARLDKLKEAKRESYEELLRKLLSILNLIKSEPEKARGILHKIQESHDRNFSEKKVEAGIPKELVKKNEKTQAKPAIKPVSKIIKPKSRARFLSLGQNH